MYDFILNMWVMRRYTSDQVNTAVTKGYITQEQCDTILSTPQIEVIA